MATPREKAVRLLVTISFGSGAVLGSFAGCIAPDPEPVTKEIVVTKTEEVEVPVEVEVIPDWCVDTIEALDILPKVLELISTSASSHLELLEESSTAIYLDDPAIRLDISQRQRDLYYEYDSAWRWDLIEGLDRIDKFYTSCKEELQ